MIFVSVFKVPAFETADGHPIYETNAIAYYGMCFYGGLVLLLHCLSVQVAGEQLHGKTKVEAAHILQFVNMADQEILPAACSWVFPTYGIMQYNKQVSRDIDCSACVLTMKHIEI